jgi:hypothetical protein
LNKKEKENKTNLEFGGKPKDIEVLKFLEKIFFFLKRKKEKKENHNITERILKIRKKLY